MRVRTRSRNSRCRSSEMRSSSIMANSTARKWEVRGGSWGIGNCASGTRPVSPRLASHPRSSPNLQPPTSNLRKHHPSKHRTGRTHVQPKIRPRESNKSSQTAKLAEVTNNKIFSEFSGQSLTCHGEVARAPPPVAVHPGAQAMGEGAPATLCKGEEPFVLVYGDCVAFFELALQQPHDGGRPWVAYGRRGAPLQD
jgi:hypothetical protein